MATPCLHRTCGPPSVRWDFSASRATDRSDGWALGWGRSRAEQMPLPLGDREDDIASTAGADTASDARGSLLRDQRDPSAVLGTQVALAWQISEVRSAGVEGLGQVRPARPRMTLPGRLRRLQVVRVDG